MIQSCNSGGISELEIFKICIFIMNLKKILVFNKIIINTFQYEKF